MKIVVTLEIEVDPESWCLIYGREPRGVRRDVKEYVLNAVQQSPGVQGADADVTLR